MRPANSRQDDYTAKTSGDVVVVGSINVDLVVRVERLPGRGETVTGGSYARHGGGKGANQAVAAARAGARVHFIGAVGDDDLAEPALAELREEGIDVSGVVRASDCTTGVALIVVERDGENQIAVASGANAQLDEAAVRASIAEKDLSSDTVCLLSFEIPDAPVVAAAQCAHAAGVRETIVNPAPARPLPEALVELGPLLTPNAGEAVALSTGAPGDDPEAAAQELVGITGGAVVVTLGADGALLVTRQVQRRYAAPKVQATDATGAGDAFNGALAAALAQRFELPQAVARAVAAASLSVQASGARGGMPAREEIDRLARGEAGDDLAPG